ncbi:MAG: hypothetical protein IT182_15255 [Acidobacteria bacterium]|nr:hypothetical protein [Acidobacteriota bacterium]
MGDSNRIDALRERRVTPAEARAYLDAPTSDAERERVLELARWFRRRYPTPLERLAYARRAYARWHRTSDLITRRGPDQARAADS